MTAVTLVGWQAALWAGHLISFEDVPIHSEKHRRVEASPIPSASFSHAVGRIWCIYMMLQGGPDLHVLLQLVHCPYSLACVLHHQQIEILDCLLKLGVVDM